MQLDNCATTTSIIIFSDLIKSLTLISNTIPKRSFVVVLVRIKHLDLYLFNKYI